jgi:hypothetical protein
LGLRVIAVDSSEDDVLVSIPLVDGGHMQRAQIADMDAWRSAALAGWVAFDNLDGTFGLSFEPDKRPVRLGAGEFVPASDGRGVWLLATEPAVTADLEQAPGHSFGSGSTVGPVGTDVVWTDPAGAVLRLTDVRTLETRSAQHSGVVSWDAVRFTCASSDGACIAVRAGLADDDSEALAIVETATLAMRVVRLPFTGLAWTPDSRCLITGDTLGELCAIDVATGAVERFGITRLDPLALAAM